MPGGDTRSLARAVLRGAVEPLLAFSARIGATGDGVLKMTNMRWTCRRVRLTRKFNASQPKPLNWSPLSGQAMD